MDGMHAKTEPDLECKGARQSSIQVGEEEHASESISPVVVDQFNNTNLDQLIQLSAESKASYRPSS